MELVIEPRKDPDMNGVFLIQDGDPSHTAHATQRYLTDDAERWWRFRCVLRSMPRGSIKPRF